MTDKWYVATYRPAALFSLRPSNATVSGGKTLLTPTPFAIKMALLDVAIRTYGLTQGQDWWPFIRDLRVAVSLPQYVLVLKTMQRILRPKKNKVSDSGLIGSWQTNIVFREYVHYGTPDVHPNNRFQVAVLPDDDELPLQNLFMRINYFGKRGSFMQFTEDSPQASLPEGFTLLNPDEPSGFQMNGTLQMLDDCGSGMTFAHADVYDGKRLSLNTDRGRVVNPVVLPYRQIDASRTFTAYQRIDQSAN